MMADDVANDVDESGAPRYLFGCLLTTVDSFGFVFRGKKFLNRDIPLVLHNFQYRN